MCAHYTLFTPAQEAEIASIVREVEKRIKDNGMNATIQQDIYPRGWAPVLKQGHDRLAAHPMVWGYLRERTQENRERAAKGLKPYVPTVVSNTKIETAWALDLWADSLKNRRCLIPCGGFFENKDRKIPYQFRAPDGKLLYIAGIYKTFTDKDGRQVERFSMLTTRPNETVCPIHSRMPVVLMPDEIELWLSPGMRVKPLEDRSRVELIALETA